jgi:hypothetical protein
MGDRLWNFRRKIFKSSGVDKTRSRNNTVTGNYIIFGF